MARALKTAEAAAANKMESAKHQTEELREGTQNTMFSFISILTIGTGRRRAFLLYLVHIHPLIVLPYLYFGDRMHLP